MFSVEPHNPQKSGKLDTRKGGKSHKIHTKVRQTICKILPISSLSTFQDRINIYCLQCQINLEWNRKGIVTKIVCFLFISIDVE